MYQITFGNPRETVPIKQEIREYYQDLIRKWNVVVSRHNWSRDKRTSEYRDCKALATSFLYLEDKILQTMREHQAEITERDEEIRRLRFELSKWTDQQTGRKPVLNQAQHEQIKAMKVEGISNRAIAKKIGVSEKTVRRSLFM